MVTKQNATNPEGDIDNNNTNVNPDGTGEEQKLEDGQNPDQTGQSADNAGNVAEPQQPDEDYSWLDKRFGDNKKEALLKQAKAYSGSLKKMHKATEEAAELRRELESIKQQYSNQQGNDYTQYPNRQNNLNSGVNYVPPEVRAQVEAMYGGMIPFEQIVAQRDIVKSTVSEQLEPILKTMSENEMNRHLEIIEKSDLSLANPDIRETFDTLMNKLPYSERGKRNRILDCLKEAKLANFESIVDMEVEKKMKGMGKPTPTSPPAKPNAQVPQQEPEELEVDKETANNLSSWATQDTIKKVFTKKRGSK